MFVNLKESLESVRFFAKTIWKHRWWDYWFLQRFMDRLLEHMEKHYGKDTHFVGAEFTKGRIIIVRKYLKEWMECDEFNDFDCKNKRKKFFKHFERNIERFWD